MYASRASAERDRQYCTSLTGAARLLTDMTVRRTLGARERPGEWTAALFVAGLRLFFRILVMPTSGMQGRVILLAW
jgi:hypothetical protein